MCLGVFLLPQRDLTADTVTGVGGGLHQFLSPLLDSLGLLAAGIEGIQQRREALLRHALAVTAVLGDGTVGKIEGFPLPQQHIWCEAISLHTLLPLGETAPQPSIHHAAVAVTVGSIDDLAGNEGRDGGKLSGKLLLCTLPVTEKAEEFVLRHGKGVAFLLLGRQFVEKSRQYLADLGHLQIHTAQAIYNAIFLVRKDQVGIAAHGLQNKRKAALLPHLIGSLDGKCHHALQGGLLHRHNAPVADVLTQQHTEHGRLGGVISQLLRHVDAGLIGIGAEEETAIAPQQQHQLIPRRLLDLLDTAAYQRRRYFIDDCLQADGIQRHLFSLHHDVEQFIDTLVGIVEIEPPKQGFQSRGLPILGNGGIVGNGVDIGVAPALKYGALLFREEGQNLLRQRCLSRRTHQLHRGAVKPLPCCLPVGAEIGAHQQFIDGIAHVGKADGRDGVNVVALQLYIEIIGHRKDFPFSFL